MKNDGLTKRRVLLGGGACLVGVGGFLPGSRAGARTIGQGKKNAAPSFHSHPLHYDKNRLSSPYVLKNTPPERPVIVLDPGHGGKDPGAIGFSGTYEKYIAMATAQMLQKKLQATGRYCAVLTRSSDKFIPLDGRVDMAHRQKAALFMSIHADALPVSSVRGASVYTLSAHASDRQSAALAATENNADRYGGGQIKAATPEVQAILASLVKEETQKASHYMASSVVSAFRQRVGLLSHPHRQAGFVVLKSADIPSVLVEMGFMSNHADEAALREGSHRVMIATALAQAVDRYFSSSYGNNRNLTG